MLKTWYILRSLVLLAVGLFLLGGSVTVPGGLDSQVQAYTRNIEFDYGTWTLDALAEKLLSWSLNLPRFLPSESQSQLVLTYLDQVQKVQTLSTQILAIYTDPGISDPESASQSLHAQLQTAQARIDELSPLAESILQAQLMDVISEAGLDVLGQVIPPSLYRSSQVPLSLVVSPRDAISTASEVSLLPGMDADDMDTLEQEIFDNIDYAALVVPIGGVGSYPTMVMQTSDLVWLTETISHEWVHNYLALHPLGLNYYTSDELRTLNETVASLAGKELGRLILVKYYPDQVPPDPGNAQSGSNGVGSQEFSELRLFNFRKEMRITRIEVDRLLAQGKIRAAENYMEARRQYFWENNYAIRKINQAYFAFYGSYNDVPGGGASGTDPIGPAVVSFRAQFDDIGSFLSAISRISSFDQLLGLLQSAN